MKFSLSILNTANNTSDIRAYLSLYSAANKIHIQFNSTYFSKQLIDQNEQINRVHI